MTLQWYSRSPAGILPNDGQLIGVLSGGVVGEGGFVEIGLGLRPELAGRGLGGSFTRNNLGWIQREYPGMEIGL